MIPRKIHYCWFGRGPMPEWALKCIDSWHRFMPDYEYKLWNEDVFDISRFPYTMEAYESGKYAFVSDVVRLYALKQEGGLYFDVDFEVYKPFDDLLHYKAFAGFEGSKHNPVMMGVIASEPNGMWVNEQLNRYKERHFLLDGNMDLTTNVKFVSLHMRENGFSLNGEEQDYLDLHVFPVDFFSPLLTTGEYRKTENTYCEHRGKESSWATQSLKSKIIQVLPSPFRTWLILFKRKIFG